MPLHNDIITIKVDTIVNAAADGTPARRAEVKHEEGRCADDGETESQP